MNRCITRALQGAIIGLTVLTLLIWAVWFGAFLEGCP